MNPPNAAHRIEMENRSHLTVSAVTGIDSSDDRTVILYTKLGKLTVLGKNMHLTQLSLETETAIIDGDIQALRYGDRDRTTVSGLRRRIQRA